MILEKVVDFGMWKFLKKGIVLIINDKVVFLRGILECNIFLFIGYFLMDK